MGTDHAPHTEADKKNGSPGLISFEFAFGMVQKAFCDAQIPLHKFVQITSQNPAKLLRKKPVQVEVGQVADLVLVDLEHKYTATFSNLETKSRNYPFENALLNGKVLMTIKGGNIKYVDRSFCILL